MIRRWLAVSLSICVLFPGLSAAFDYAGADRLAARLPDLDVGAMLARDDCLCLPGSGFLQVYDTHTEITKWHW